MYEFEMVKELGELEIRAWEALGMLLPDGRRFSYCHNFGKDYSEEDAMYMFTEGNYSCDCNRSLFLNYAGNNVDLLKCGHTIKIVAFKCIP